MKTAPPDEDNEVIINLRNFKAKPIEIQAFQFSGEVKEAKYLSQKFGRISVDTTDGKFNGMIQVRTKTNHVKKAAAKDYLVFLPDNTLAVFTPQEFSTAFQEL